MATTTYGSGTAPTATPTDEAVRTALGTVNDPEIHKPITDLGMVKSVDIAEDGTVAVTVYLTVSGCPMRDTITARPRGVRRAFLWTFIRDLPARGWSFATPPSQPGPG